MSALPQNLPNKDQNDKIKTMQIILALFMSESNDMTAIRTLRPLIIASSGGGGHIAAAQGILDWMKSSWEAHGATQENQWFVQHYSDDFANTCTHSSDPVQQFEVDFSITHQATLASERWFSLSRSIVTFGIFLYSLPFFRPLLTSLTHLCGGFNLPQQEEVERELNKFKKEAEDHPTRPYVDFLPDIYPAGDVFAAIFNALQANDRTQDIEKTISGQSFSDRWHYQIAYKKIFRMLLTAARAGRPYSEIVSTQPQAIAALCDAVIDYNAYVERQLSRKSALKERYAVLEKLLENATTKRKINYIKNQLTTLADEMGRISKLTSIYINQYLTDLPTDLVLIDEQPMPQGAGHFIDPLIQLSPQQTKHIRLHAVGPLAQPKLQNHSLFKSLYNIDPSDNPMVRAGFKDPDLLKTYTNEAQVTLSSQESLSVSNTPVLQNTILNPTDQVYSIMLGSLGGNASEEYVNLLLAHLSSSKDFTIQHHIYLFRSNNTSLEERLRAELNTPSSNCHLHYLPRVDDQTIARIMTRSNHVIIRSGGLSTMEQMALPILKNKKYYTHAPEEKNGHSTTGLEWEDANARRLQTFIQEKEATAAVYITQKQHFIEHLKAENAPSSTLASPPPTQKSTLNDMIDYFFRQKPKPSSTKLSFFERSYLYYLSFGETTSHSNDAPSNGNF